MIKTLIYTIAILAVGVFFGYELANLNKPAVVILNLTKASIPEIRVESDVGETYIVGSLAPDTTHRLKISGREKAVWIAIAAKTGPRKESQKRYVTSQGILYAVITDSEIIVDYQL